MATTIHPTSHVEATLKKYFGFSTFRPYQHEIIKNILQGRDCLVVMATGSGKSLCYQLPPLITKMTAVVISPLISLMQDQVMSLKERGIKSEYLSSAQTDGSVYSRVLNGEYHIVYMTPEKALTVSKSFWSGLLQKGLSLLAIDEAHCISEWGHDFRQEYRKIHALRSLVYGVPFVALTATATKRVREDIVKSLQLDDAFTLVSTFDRPNLFYAVKIFNRTSAFRKELASEVRKDVQSGGSTLIYCNSIKDVEEVTESLNQDGILARPYHASMNKKDREVVHRQFARDELQIVVATIAFGMGIDKPDIRRVIHYGCPKSLESYYQESGRCGRDGLPSTCVLYFTRSDFGKADFYTSSIYTASQRAAVKESYLAAQKYCTTTLCRRKIILEYFGERVSFENCGKCDNCTRSEAETERDMYKEAHLLLSSIKLCGGHYGLNLPIDVLRGSHSKKVMASGFDQLPIYGLGREKSANWWKSLGDQLLAIGYLQENIQDIYRFVNLGPVGENFLRIAPGNQVPLRLPISQEMAEEERKKSGGSNHAPTCSDISSVETNPQMEGFTELEIKFYNSLVLERAELAKQCSTAPYALCSERTLQNLAKARPSNIARLVNIEGINQWLVKEHGERILAVIHKLSEEFGVPLDSSNPPKTSEVKEVAKVTSAKHEAWRMWQEEGISLSGIANLPERPVPIKEETIIGYLFDCIRAGYKVDWTRFCKETGFTKKIAEEVYEGIQKAGSKDRLKPIKEQLPEHVTYTHIRLYLLMEELNFPFPSTSSNEAEISCDAQKETNYNHCESFQNDEEICTLQVVNDNSDEDRIVEPASIDSEIQSLSKRRKGPVRKSEECSTESSKKLKTSASDDTDVSLQSNIPTVLNEATLLSWLRSHDEVMLDSLLSAFPASKDSIMDLLLKLEEDFLVYRKNGSYKVM